jgi:WD40 repeat protein
VFSAAFSPDGKTLASGGWSDGRVKLWDVATGQFIGNFEAQDVAGSIHWVALSPDGRTLAGTVKLKEGGTAIKLWDWTTGKHKATFKGADLGSFTFSPDSKTLASVGGNQIAPAIKLWDVASGKNTMNLNAWEGVWSFAFSPDGKTLAADGGEGSVKLWDLTSGKKDPVVEWRKGRWETVVAVAFNPDGTALAAGGARDLMSFGVGTGTIYLWDLASHQEKTSFPEAGDGENIHSLAFSPDGKILASGRSWGWVQLWDANTGERKATVRHEHARWVASLAFSPDGKVLASAGLGGGICLWDLPGAR